ncbi:chromosomal replication initiator protein [Xanthobacter flavus]|uniref:Chromosomal replication initiator protein DnaA n=1 Tax=Xanthobacter flavus TaxID=281 RepID=A0A9W6FJV6_XANFL|nr:MULTISPECIES: chromosomal replication initiator protein DnaA [Xanthobacter]MDR6333606.1 chromosomal replication initiator protein [Xanthobacter flavus]NMN59153.1 chromosomal replication initiator protein [Xanthobacter sp. SG618]GLI20642.1 chromosomal replication initiator protein DnaA [Xanthobacter flavus]
MDCASNPSASAGPWDRVLQRLREEIGEEKFTSWFARMDLDALTADVVRLSVPTRFLKSWIQENYLPRITDIWAEETGARRRVDLAVRNAFARPVALKASAPREVVSERTERPVESKPAPRASEARGEVREMVPTGGDVASGSPLDPRLTFESFVVGKSNSLAFAAARKVAETPAGAAPVYNPLYLHAAVGLGKTHLLQAVARAGAAHGRRTTYLTAERFMYGFVSALKSHSAIAFKDTLRTIDTLVIDDLQFLKGNNLQQEFCHTLNALLDGGRQVVLAADCLPGELEHLDERVRSRLAGGLVVELAPLEEDLRLEILKARYQTLAEQHQGFAVPAPVLEFLARSVGQSGRDLDGALNKLLAFNQLTGEPVTLDMAENAVKDLIRPTDPKRVRVDDILRVVAKHYNVSRADLLSQRRTATVVKPRQIAMYLAKTLTLRSLPEIGRRFGGRDHTTVLHAVRKIDGLVATDRALADEIEVLKRLALES